MVAGFIVNRMRGDRSLFAAGMGDRRPYRLGRAGLVPFFPDAHRLPAEDAADLALARRPGAAVRIAVPVLPWISNFDDLDPLAAEPGVDLHLVPRGEPLPVCDLVILPGSKATIADLAALRAEGWDIDLRAHHRRGGRILGLCGGYQMLGRSLADPDGVEGSPGNVAGLGLAAGGHGAGRRQASGGGAGRAGRRAVPRLRDACRPHDGRGGAVAARGGRPGRGRSRPTAWCAGATCMGCSPPMRSARRGCAGWGPRRPRGTTRRRWRPCSTGLAAHVEAHVDVDCLLALAR